MSKLASDPLLTLGPLDTSDIEIIWQTPNMTTLQNFISFDNSIYYSYLWLYDMNWPKCQQNKICITFSFAINVEFYYIIFCAIIYNTKHYQHIKQNIWGHRPILIVIQKGCGQKNIWLPSKIRLPYHAQKFTSTAKGDLRTVCVLNLTVS